MLIAETQMSIKVSGFVMMMMIHARRLTWEGLAHL